MIEQATVSAAAIALAMKPTDFGMAPSTLVPF